MKDLKIREVKVEDFENVRDLFIEENRYHASILPEQIKMGPPMTKEEWSSFREQKDRRIFVADNNGQVLGLIDLQIREREMPTLINRKSLFVKEIIVSEHARGKGIGKNLIERAKVLARELEIKEIELNVWTANQSAIEFYEKLNFTCQRKTYSVFL